MNKTSNQLDTVFQEVNEYFADIPAITVMPGEGNPPDQYTVSFRITGMCRENSGEVYSCDNHVISISLPFGFPHFPPNCIPESPTFHPDFDSSAICIGDVWEADKSIITLITHIARMISGEIYSKSNAFNEEASDWYRDNRDKLPFDTPDLDKITPTPIEEDIEEGIDWDVSDDDLKGIDTLDDDDFGTSFAPLKESTPPVKIDTDRLRVIAKQKRFQALSRELQSIHEPFEGREGFEEQTRTAMDQAMAIYHEADKLEHQGKQKEALEKYTSIEKLVSDYPNLQEAKDRVQQAFDLLGDWVNNVSDDQDSNDTAEDSETSVPDPDSNAPSSAKRTFFEDSKAVSKKLFFFALACGSIALIVTLTLSYLSLGSNLKKARKQFDECQNLLAADNFQGAEKKCNEALRLTTEIRLVKQNEKDELAKKIENLLASPKFRQGLAGKILFDGQYITETTKEFLLTFQEAKKNGDSFFTQERWADAVSSYAKALEIAKKTEAIDDAMLAEVNQKHSRAQFNSMMHAGEKSLSISDWNGATTHFGKALQLAKANPNVLPEDISQLELLSNQAKFNTLRDQGHEFFNAGEWDKALSSYQLALDLVQKLNLSKSDTISSLHENIAKTKIYMTIEKGKKAFAASKWDEVIAQYEKAIILLEENSKLLSRIDTEESRIKLSRIMLHAEIIKNKQDVAKHLKSDDFALAIGKLESIQKAITKSQFADQAEFTTIFKEIANQIEEAEKQLLLIEQTSYLTDNYEQLFLKHYPAATRSALSAPAVEYLRDIDDKILFRMQCTETSGGRPLRLQMDYLYSPSTKKWSFYTEE